VQIKSEERIREETIRKKEKKEKRKKKKKGYKGYFNLLDY